MPSGSVVSPMAPKLPNGTFCPCDVCFVRFCLSFLRSFLFLSFCLPCICQSLLLVSLVRSCYCFSVCLWAFSVTTVCVLFSFIIMHVVCLSSAIPVYVFLFWYCLFPFVLFMFTCLFFVLFLLSFAYRANYLPRFSLSLSLAVFIFMCIFDV